MTGIALRTSVGTCIRSRSCWTTPLGTAHTTASAIWTPMSPTSSRPGRTRMSEDYGAEPLRSTSTGQLGGGRAFDGRAVELAATAGIVVEGEVLGGPVVPDHEVAVAPA